MSSKQIQVSERGRFTVSTVRIGRTYETAICFGGSTSDGMRTASIADARRAHDFALRFLSGDEKWAPGLNRSVDFWRSAVADVTNTPIRVMNVPYRDA